MTKTNIAIIGGGFGGLYTALELEKRLRRRPDVSVTLFNEENFFLFTPMLPEAAGCRLGVRQIVSPIRKLVGRTQFAEMKVDGINMDTRVISARHSLTGRLRQYAYDHLVLAPGSVTNYFNVPGAQEFAIPIKTLGDAIYVRNHAIDMLEEAAIEPERRDELLTFVVVGGGLTGVEVTGAMNDFVREAASFYPELERGRIRVMLVEALPRLMPEMSDELAAFSERVLKERGVEVRTRTSVTAVEAGAITLSTGERVATRTLIWGAGVGPNPLLAALDVPKSERGKVLVNEYLEVVDRPDVWAVGDCAQIPNPRSDKPYPPTAQHAVREGRRAARNIAARFGLDERAPFDYRSRGQMALIGRRTGVAEVMGHRFSGSIAWFLWRTYYLMQLPLLEKKLRVVLDWTLDLFFAPDLVQLGVTRQLLAEPVPAPRQPSPAQAPAAMRAAG